MPRPGPRRPIFGVRLSEGEVALIDLIAASETHGNRSEAIRKLVGEALWARTQAPATPDTHVTDRT